MARKNIGGGCEPAEPTPLNKAAEVWGKAHCSPEHVTPVAILDLLREAVLESGAILPRPPDPPDPPAHARLATIVNALRWKVLRWKVFEQAEFLNGEHSRTWLIQCAVVILTEILPATREQYVNGAATARQLASLEFSPQLRADFKQDIPGDPAGEAEADLAAFDALAAAGSGARKRGLPHIADPIIAMTEKTEKWEHYAEDLEARFHRVLPGQSKAAAYRFIVAVTPTITGELTTFLAVQNYFKPRRKRDREAALGNKKPRRKRGR